MTLDHSERLAKMNSAPANYNASVYACFVVFIVVITSAVIARAVSRKIQKAPFWFDDVLVYTFWSVYAPHVLKD